MRFLTCQLKSVEIYRQSLSDPINYLKICEIKDGIDFALLFTLTCGPYYWDS